MDKTIIMQQEAQKATGYNKILYNTVNTYVQSPPQLDGMLEPQL